MTPNAIDSTTFFSAQAGRWNALYERKAGFRDRLTLFTGAVQRACRPPASILDFGCGTGAMSLMLGQLGYRVHGVDGAAGMIDIARMEKARLQLAQTEFDVCQSSEFSPAPGSYDVVLCSSVVEYVQDDLGLVAKLVDATAPGGTLLISVPHSASLSGRMEDALRHSVRFMSRRGSRHLNYSLRRYDRRRLLAQLEGLGLTVHRCTFFELPLLGRFGVALSRMRALGVMVLISARKDGQAGPRQSSRLLVHRSAERRTINAVSRLNLWGATPWAIKRAIGIPVSLLGPGLLLGRRFRRTLRFVRCAQWWPAEHARQYQLRQVRRICTLAYERSPFYRRWFDQAGVHPASLRTLGDLAKLPTIDRTTLRDHLRDMGTQPWPPKHADSVATGATGGVPLRFYINADRSATEFAYLVATWERSGYTLGAPVAVLRGNVVARRRNGMHYSYDPLLRHHCYSNFHTSEPSLTRYVEHISGLESCFLHVYPSSADVLARFLQRSGRKLPGIRAVLVESEIVYEDQRRRAERIFGCRYFSCYGHTEKLVLAAECEQSTDYHVWPTYGYFELLDEAGRPVTAPGQRGEIVGTGFINTVVPFIRYRTGDYATYVADRCEACGREQVIIRDIEGHRTQEVLVMRDGSTVSWTALNMHDDTFEHVRQFQFCQDTPGRALLRIVPAAGFSPENERRIRASLSRKLDGLLEFDIQCVPLIPLTPRGKAIYVDQRIPVAAAASAVDGLSVG